MNRYLTVGLTVVAGAAVIEAALIPGLAVGAAAVLAPRFLRGLTQRLRSATATPARPAAMADTQRSRASAAAPRSAGPARFRIGQAVAKTITFRIIVTTLDFTSNYLVIGELNTAAGLSVFNLVAGPPLYLGHETAWNYFGPPESDDVAVRMQLAPGFRVSRALAKTITFRTIATIFDFTVSYVVVRDVATAAGLAAFGFFVGPFVYFAHERVWDRFGAPRAETTRLLPPPARALPAPG